MVEEVSEDGRTILGILLGVENMSVPKLVDGDIWHTPSAFWIIQDSGEVTFIPDFTFIRLGLCPSVAVWFGLNKFAFDIRQVE